MLMLLSSLMIVMLQNLWLYKKTLQKITVSHQAFYELEEVAAHLIKRNIHQCVSLGQEPTQIARQLLSHPSCSIEYNHEVYYYSITHLGDFPCLQITQNGKQYSSSHSLLSVVEKTGKMIQIRRAKVIAPLACQGVVQKSRAGTLSWLYLSSL